MCSLFVHSLTVAIPSFMSTAFRIAVLIDRFDDITQKALRAQVLIVSPSPLTMAIDVAKATLRGSHAIQVDVGRLLGGMRLLVERVGKLAAHKAKGDLASVEAAIALIQRRSQRIEAMEFDEAEPEEAPDLLRLARCGAQQNRPPAAEDNGPFPHARGGAAGPQKAAS